MSSRGGSSSTGKSVSASARRFPSRLLLLVLLVLLGCKEGEEEGPDDAVSLPPPPPPPPAEDVLILPDGVPVLIECTDDTLCEGGETCIEGLCVPRRPCKGLCREDSQCEAGLICSDEDDPRTCVVDPSESLPLVEGTYSVAVGDPVGCEGGATIPFVQGEVPLTLAQPCEGKDLEAEVALITVNPTITSYTGWVQADGAFQLRLTTPVTTEILDSMPGCAMYYDLTIEGTLGEDSLEGVARAQVAFVMVEQQCEVTYRLICEVESPLSGVRTGDLDPLCGEDGDCPETQLCEGGYCVQRASCGLPCDGDRHCLPGMSCQVDEEGQGSCAPVEEGGTIRIEGELDLVAEVVENSCGAETGETRATLDLDMPCSEAQTVLAGLQLLPNVSEGLYSGLLDGEGGLHLETSTPLFAPHPLYTECFIAYDALLEGQVMAGVVEGTITHSGTFYQYGGGACQASGEGGCSRVDTFRAE